MRARARLWIVVVISAVAVACGDEPDPMRAQHEALLQRLDAMEQRIDVLEDARIPASAQDPSPSQSAFAADDGFRVTLPAAAAAEPLAPALHIHVRSDSLHLNGEAVTRAEASARFEGIALERPDTRLTVLVEPEVPHRTLMEVLDLAKAAGLDSIAISARVHDPDEPEP